MLAQPFAERQKMIILHPDEILFLDESDEAVRELLVDPLIAASELGFIFGEVDAVVKERPQRPVRIAIVIFVDVVRFEVDRRGGEAVGALHGELAGEARDLIPRPAEPDRSEEHTSELQSLMRISYAVFCLKKQKNKNRYDNEQNQS